MLANKLSVLPENNVVRPALLFIGSFRYELWGMHDDNIGIKLGDSRNMSYGGSSKVLLSFFFFFTPLCLLVVICLSSLYALSLFCNVIHLCKNS